MEHFLSSAHEVGLEMWDIVITMSGCAAVLRISGGGGGDVDVPLGVMTYFFIGDLLFECCLLLL